MRPSAYLWARDAGIAWGHSPVAPRLVAFDLRTNQPLRIYTFEGSVTIHDGLNDVRIDQTHQTAYLTAAANHGGIGRTVSRSAAATSTSAPRFGPFTIFEVRLPPG